MTSGVKGAVLSRKAIVVHPWTKQPASAMDALARSAPSALEEAMGLARAIGLEVVHAQTVPLARPRPATLFGSGKVDELQALVAGSKAELLIVDAALSAIQQRNLERALRCKVIDRTGLILEIFGERARTREGVMQVELAHLSYQQSRLVRSWTHLERQRGGYGFLGGPGETQIEADRRLLRQRIARLKKDLEEVRRTRALHRRERRKVPYPIVALIGYTNAGKSTLFNRLTAARVVAADMLFATLDPTMRLVRTPAGRKVLLSDTVGFISNLPTQLVAAFRATLEEVVEADIILHVRDIAHPDSAAQRRDVLDVLAGLVGEGEVPGQHVLEVQNKVDLLPPDAAAAVRERAKADPDTITLSALNGEGCEALLARIDALLRAASRDYEVVFATDDGATRSWLYAHGEVVTMREGEDGRTLARVRLSDKDAGRLGARPGLALRSLARFS
ncbi:MAG: GTPase HflX [Pseudomonadota bacterium]